MSGSIVPKKALGQNFLISDRVCRRILRLAAISPDDIVLEIGPGTGFLTHHLLAAAARVIAIEKDPDLVAQLRERWPEAEEERFRLFQGDILEFPLESILPERPVKIVGNLPYNIATSTIKRMKACRDRFQNATFMVQKEVAQRLLAQPGDREFGYFTVWTALHFERRTGFDVAPGCFRPIPRVQSSVLQLIPNREEAVDDPFDTFLGLAFQQPRKTLRNNLRSYDGKLEGGLQEAGIPLRARPHQVAADAYRRLWNLIGKAAATGAR